MTAADAKGAFTVVQAADTPWFTDGKPAAERLVLGLTRKPGAYVDLAHKDTGKWLGKYVAIKASDTARYSVWVLAESK